MRAVAERELELPAAANRDFTFFDAPSATDEAYRAFIFHYSTLRMPGDHDVTRVRVQLGMAASAALSTLKGQSGPGRTSSKAISNLKLKGACKSWKVVANRSMDPPSTSALELPRRRVHDQSS